VHNRRSEQDLKLGEDDFYKVNDGTTLLLPSSNYVAAKASKKDRQRNQSPLMEYEDLSLAQLINNSMSIAVAPQPFKTKPAPKDQS
jgi:hypothetical protein